SDMSETGQIDAADRSCFRCARKEQVRDDNDDFFHGRVSYPSMKLTLEDNPRLNRIRSYSNTEVRVSDRVLNRSCIVAPDMVIPDWRPSDVSDLRESDLEVLLSTKP